MDFLFAQYSVIYLCQILRAFKVVLMQRPSDSHTQEQHIAIKSVDMNFIGCSALPNQRTIVILVSVFNNFTGM